MTQRKYAISAAIRLLEGERTRGFREAAHRMLFPRAYGFTGASDEQVGLVFQRALIAQALLDAQTAGFDVDLEGVASDVEFLLAAKCRDLPGGWRYFPDLPELPPDADDLAEVLRLLVATGHQEIAMHCDPAIRLALADQHTHAGGFRTWVLDPGDDGERNRAVRAAIDTQWGDTVDVEVVANLLHALAVYDAARYCVEVGSGVRYVASQQSESGAWPSTWYHGDYYGTFVCVRFLAVAAPDHEALHRVPPLLFDSQHEDGGFGHGVSTANDTSLALLVATILAKRADKPFAAALDRAVEYLIGCQSADGAWPATDFIRMDTSRVRTLTGEGKPTIVSHQSLTLTSALCLKALVAAHRWER